MSDHLCEAAIVTCIDFRLQPFINQWIAENFNERTYDRIAIAGGVFDLSYILKQIDISERLHHIKKVILINHEDCGAYGEAGTAQKHTEDLKNAAAEIKKQFPQLTISAYYLRLNGDFELII